MNGADVDIQGPVPAGTQVGTSGYGLWRANGSPLSQLQSAPLISRWLEFCEGREDDEQVDHRTDWSCGLGMVLATWVPANVTSAFLQN